MNRNEIYDFSYKYLLEISKNVVSKEEIDAFINETDTKELNNLADVFEMLLSILQDFQMFPKVINYNVRKNDIKEIIHFPDIEYCASLNSAELAKVFIDRFAAKGEKSWTRYSKGIVSGAKFLNNFKTLAEFKAMCDSFDKNIMTREAYALFLQTKIDNMGFASACNWLKELGYKDYLKPDVHIKDICVALELVDSNANDMLCFEAAEKVAEDCKVDAYKLDKVWWLICSGNYYRLEKQLPNPQKNKEDFLKKISQ